MSPAAIDVLLAIAAPLLDGGIARLYGNLRNDPGRNLVDEQLLRDVLGGRVSFHDIAAALAPRAPLVRLGIVHVASSHLRPVAALEVDEVVLQRLRGEPIQLGMMPVIRAASRELAELALAPSVVMSVAEGLERAGDPRGSSCAGARAPAGAR